MTFAQNPQPPQRKKKAAKKKERLRLQFRHSPSVNPVVPTIRGLSLFQHDRFPRYQEVEGFSQEFPLEKGGSRQRRQGVILGSVPGHSPLFFLQVLRRFSQVIGTLSMG
jgi:hypothetical protein